MATNMDVDLFCTEECPDSDDDLDWANDPRYEPDDTAVAEHEREEWAEFHQSLRWNLNAGYDIHGFERGPFTGVEWQCWYRVAVVLWLRSRPRHFHRTATTTLHDTLLAMPLTRAENLRAEEWRAFLDTEFLLYPDFYEVPDPRYPFKRCQLEDAPTCDPSAFLQLPELQLPGSLEDGWLP